MRRQLQASSLLQSSSVFFQPVAPSRIFSSTDKPKLRAGVVDGPLVAAIKNREVADRNSGKRPSFHTRDFPKSLVDYRSELGRECLIRALTVGTACQYLDLTATYQMQSEPAYCALTTLAVAMNALHLDPNKVWKGGWRWFTESNLDFCMQRGSCQLIGLEEGRGLNIFDLRCVARKNGASLKIHIADRKEGFSETYFRNEVKALCSNKNSDCVMICYFDRKELDQTGGGHFSPVAAYDEETDSVLILDVARFKYPPFWATIPQLCRAMEAIEPSSDRPRGFAYVRHGDGKCCIDDNTHDTCSVVCNTPHS